MTIETINIPDVGGDQVEVIEICVNVGDHVELEDTIVVLESDKASMEIPALKAGIVKAIKLSEGDKVGEGAALIELELVSASLEVEAEVAPVPAETPVTIEPTPTLSAASVTTIEVPVPDVGGESEVIEISVAVGDEIQAEDSLCVLESDKASMEVPAPQAGKIVELLMAVGDKVTEGVPMLVLEVAAQASPAAIVSTQTQAVIAESAAPVVSTPSAPSNPALEQGEVGVFYAGPLVRKLARELGVDLSQVASSGPRGRVLKQDLHAYVKSLVSHTATSVSPSAGSAIPAVPEVDFSEFGEVRLEKLTKIEKVTAMNMHRSWLNVPHVTQFDDVDITDLEAFRKSMKVEAANTGVKLTPLPFLLKACAAALAKHPKLGSSLHADGEQLVYKDYIHIGIAVDTPAGLMVPVIRDVDKKGLYELAEESTALAEAAKNRKLKPRDMKGGCFTISSLGGLGGKGFTPIVNTPEVAILGVSRLSTQPIWDGEQFMPRQMLPLSLSYDHRVVNGADAGKFFADLAAYLQEIRRLLV